LETIVADLKGITEEGGEGEAFSDSGLIDQIETALLNYVGKRVRIRITEYRPFYPYKEVDRRGKND